MSVPPQELVRELIEHSETHQGLIPESSGEHVRKMTSGEISPDDSDHLWIIGIFVGDGPVAIGAEPARQPGISPMIANLTYVPPEAEKLEASYRDEYSGLVGALQDIHRLKPAVKLKIEGDVVEETRIRMLAEDTHLLGGFATAQSASTGEAHSNLFVSRTLIDVYGRVLRDHALAIDVDSISEDRRTEKLVRDIFGLKQMRAEELVALSAGTIVAALMPKPDETGDIYPK